MRASLCNRSILLLVNYLWALSLSSAFTSTPESGQRSVHLSAFASFPSLRNGGEARRTPYIIDRLPRSANDQLFSEISEMCISVFFNNGTPTKNSGTPWKGWQLGYLKGIQRADLKFRKTSRKLTNDMFVARRVVPVPSTSIVNQPLILDCETIYNAQRETDKEYVRGEILGFCEVTERPFGLGYPYDEVQGKGRGDQFRPVLTNLSVKMEARRSGVGSELLKACEAAVTSWNGCRGYCDEIVLEVEDDNPRALRFYKNRGYKHVFSDPTSRRFDTSGFLLKQERTTKMCLRKDLSVQRAVRADKNRKSSMRQFGLNLIPNLSVFQMAE